MSAQYNFSLENQNSDGQKKLVFQLFIFIEKANFQVFENQHTFFVKIKSEFIVSGLGVASDEPNNK